MAMIPLVLEKKRLEETAQRLASALDHVMEAVAILDSQDSIIVHANGPFIQLFGTLRDGAVRPRFLDLFKGPDLAAALEQARSGEAWMGRSSLKTRSGRRIAFEGSVAPLPHADGLKDACVVRLRDITLEVERDHQIRQSRKMEALGVLAGGMAHDFNNLIGAILNAAELIETQIEPGNPILKKLDIIQRVGSRAKALSKQVLNFSRRTEDHWTSFDLTNLVLEVIHVLQTTLPKNVEVRSDLASGIRLYGDASQLHQVIMNLGINGSQAMPDGGILTIRLQQVEADEGGEFSSSLEPFAILSVEDTGCGMDQSTQDRIFEPFFTTKKMGQGTGLGLSVVLGIVQGHRGTVRVTSRPNKGSAFKVCLPLQQDTPSGSHTVFREPFPGGNLETGT